MGSPRAVPDVEAPAAHSAVPPAAATEADADRPAEAPHTASDLTDAAAAADDKGKGSGDGGDACDDGSSELQPHGRSDSTSTAGLIWHPLKHHTVLQKATTQQLTLSLQIQFATE